MKKYIYLLSMVLALSCAKQENPIPTINLAEGGVNDINPEFLLNDIVESVTFTQLESNDSLFYSVPIINSINDNGDYCFVDQMNNSTISIYRKDGKLVSYFNRMGHGEGEYVFINSLLYDGDDKIEVLYSDKNVIYQYNKKGEYLSKKSMEGSFLVRPLGEGKYFSIMSANKEKNSLDFVRIIDSEGNVSERFLPIDTTKTDGMTASAASVTRVEDGYNFPISSLSRGDIYYHYNIKENSVSEICRFDVGAYRITPDVFQNGGNPSEYIVMIEPQKVNHYLFVQYFNRGNFVIDVWDLATCKMLARRAPADKSEGKLSYKLPNGESIAISSWEFTAHKDQLIVKCEPASLVGKIPDAIDPEGNLVILTMTLKN